MSETINVQNATDAKTTKRPRGRPKATEPLEERRKRYNKNYRENHKDYAKEYYHKHPEKYNKPTLCEICNHAYRKNQKKMHESRVMHQQALAKMEQNANQTGLPGLRPESP